jgi:hypothetical protein
MPGQTLTLLDKQGEGVIERIWFTTDRAWQEIVKKKQGLSTRSLTIRIFWDGCETPAVEAPVCDLFNQPFGPQAVKNAVANSDGDLDTFCLYLPMPFKKSVRVEMHNGGKHAYRGWFEFCIIEKKLPDNAMYLHTQFNEVKEDGKPVPVLRQIQGKGRFLGAHISAVVPNVDPKWSWYTRRVSFQVDQEQEAITSKPNLQYGSLDDFVGSAWWSMEAIRERFEFPYFGRHHVSHTKNDTELHVAMYRYFIQDPIWFKTNISIAFRGRKRDECSWRILSYFYLDTPGRPQGVVSFED